ncbi:MAG TPA: hypothetical protein VIF88_11965 [Methylocystis sp.]|jgi:hypothetical protein
MDRKTKRILDLLAARLTPQELAAVFKILSEPEPVSDARWINPGHYGRAQEAARLQRRQEKVEREWREWRARRAQSAVAAEKEFAARYPDAPKVEPYAPESVQKKIVHDGASSSSEADFFKRYPDAKLIGEM